MASTQPSSYLSPALQGPDFSSSSYANTLILSTNNSSDTPLDLSTPLSRVLFDVQEVDTHIDTLTTQSALSIVQHTRTQNDSATRVLETVEEQVASLNESYTRLQREIGGRYEAAEQVRLAAENVLRALRLGRSVQRVVGLGRQLQSGMEEVERGGQGGGYRSMLPCARTVLELKDCFAGGEGPQLARVNVASQVRQEILSAAERNLAERCKGVVREFSMSSLAATNTGGSGEKTFAQAEETKARATAATQTLYLLSPVKIAVTTTAEDFEPALLIAALQAYLQSALTSSLAALSRALATLPTLDRACLEVSARCQNIIALESLLSDIKPPSHPLLKTSPASVSTPANLLDPLLRYLDTSSLPSYFWRSMASQLTSRVQEILTRGGVSARTLRSNKDRVREAVRECVDRGYRGKSSVHGGSWEREAAVMVGSVMGPIGR